METLRFSLSDACWLQKKTESLSEGGTQRLGEHNLSLMEGFGNVGREKKIQNT
jgi:hypothetical protein